MQLVRRVIPVLLAIGAVAVAGTGVSFVIASGPPAAVSVPDVLNRFRAGTPSPTTSPGKLPPAPAQGVYLYRTVGGERVSAGDVRHKYPKVTTLTVTYGGCGLDVRWDALSGRSQVWHLCPAGDSWTLQTYVDTHKFLYLTDVHSYTCTGGPWTLTAATRTVTCDTATGKATSVISVVGTEEVPVGGAQVPTTHVHMDQTSTGTSTSKGSMDLWLVTATGLPARAQTQQEGSQHVLGQIVTYHEVASYTLLSLTPRR